MSNVISMFESLAGKVASPAISLSNVRNLRTATAEKGQPDNIFFPVGLVPLREMTGLKDDGLQAVLRQDTNTVLAVHGRRYKLTLNQEIYEMVERLISRTPNLRTDGMYVQDSLTHAGGRTIRSYVFPEHTITTGQGDETLLRISVMNSYDGSCNMQVFVGGYRIVCANGMVIGADLARYSSRHTNTFDEGLIKHRIAAALTNFLEVGPIWRKWAVTPCSHESALAVLAELAGSSESTLKDLESYWVEERAALGSNIWALFNAMTYWSTHQKVKESSVGNKAAIVLGREARVSRTLTHDLFKVA